jgi:NhaP-type Na+/H+ and K+/H+ antiporter
MRFLLLAVLLALTPMMAGCEVIEGVFKAGFFVGILVVVLLVAGVGFLVMKMR